MVKGCADTEGEGADGGGDAEGDEVRQGIEFLAHEGGFFAPAGDFAVHEVEEEAQRHKSQRKPEIRGLAWIADAVAEGREDGHDAAEAC